MKSQPSKPKFVVPEHHATRLPWAFRLEIGGVLKNWAVPQGVSRDPAVRRLTVEVPDHALSSLSFTGTLPEGPSGAGQVYGSDLGSFEAVGGDTLEGWGRSALGFRPRGQRLKGEWRLLRMKGR